MYSRSHSCLRKRKAHDLFGTRTSQTAPLEFLYPRWYTQSSAASEASPSDLALPYRVIDDEQPNHGRGRRTRRVRTARRTNGLWAQCLEHDKTRSAVERDIMNLKFTVRRRKELAGIVEKRQHHRPAGSIQTIGDEEAAILEPTIQIRRPKTNAVTPLQKEVSSQRSFRYMIDKAKHKQDISWTVLARVLARAMRSPAQREREEVLLRERTIIDLTGTAHENTWIHQSRGGCEIHVLPKVPGSTGPRTVLLYGSEVARGITRQDLTAADEQVNAVTGADYEDLERYIRWVPIDFDSDPDTKDLLRADKLPEPEEWSVRTFSTHVKKLCSMRLPRGVQRELYPGEETLHRNVANVFERLFTSAELAPYLSSHALNLALQYTCKHTELSSTTELLFDRAKSAGLHHQTWTFNLMIERALKVKRLDRVEELVKEMLAADVVPDGMTWSKLLLVTPTKVGRRHILDFIFRTYPGEYPVVLARLAKSLVEVEMVQMVQSSNRLQPFLERLDASLGPQWLASRTLDKILKTCADNQLWQSADEMLEVAKQRKIRMVPSTVKALMYLHYKSSNLEAAIDLLNSPWVLQLGYDGTSLIHWAFLTAWRLQRYNVCRVLWQYAATRGLISYQMQMRVYGSLIRNQNLAALPEHQAWEDVAGKLIIGTDLDTTNFDTQFPRLSKYFSTTTSPLQWLGQWTPNNGTREEQMSLAYVMIHRDLAAWKVFKPLSRHELPALLSAAHKRDRAWASEKFHEHATLAEMLENAIQIPLVAANQHRHFNGNGSVPSAEAREKRIDTRSLPGWQTLSKVNLSSRMAFYAAALSKYTLQSPWPVSTLPQVLRPSMRYGGAGFSWLWQYLAQRVGLHPPHSVA